jgi:hypothetical protein
MSDIDNRINGGEYVSCGRCGSASTTAGDVQRFGTADGVTEAVAPT